MQCLQPIMGQALCLDQPWADAWSLEDMGGATHIATPYGVMPAAIQQLRPSCAQLDLRTMVGDGALYMVGLDATRVSLVEDLLDFHRWLPGRTQPARLLLHPRNPGSYRQLVHTHWVSTGHYGNWLIPADSLVTTDDLRAPLTPLVGTSCPVERWTA